MSTADKILKEIKEKDVKYVDVRFTDTKGKLQHVTFDIDLVDEDFLNDGTMFDGSSIAGWKAINESDMKLRSPDLTTAYHRPVLPADDAVPVLRRREPGHRHPYNRDPRSIAKKPP
jgi:glutamine synthetase